ncbi:hypothetical protein ONZ45_g1142 [Pleurotus djamor]|nr:hypothetical protein ONZ45_g1142 [Pleurotus djamor]
MVSSHSSPTRPVAMKTTLPSRRTRSSSRITPVATVSLRELQIVPQSEDDHASSDSSADLPPPPPSSNPNSRGFLCKHRENERHVHGVIINRGPNGTERQGDKDWKGDNRCLACEKRKKGQPCSHIKISVVKKTKRKASRSGNAVGAANKPQIGIVTPVHQTPNPTQSPPRKMQKRQYESDHEESELDINPRRQTVTPRPKRVSIQDEPEEIPDPRVNTHRRPPTVALEIRGGRRGTPATRNNAQKIQEIKKFMESTRRAGVEMAQYALRMATESEKGLELIEEL